MTSGFRRSVPPPPPGSHSALGLAFLFFAPVVLGLLGFSLFDPCQRRGDFRLISALRWSHVPIVCHPRNLETLAHLWWKIGF